MINYQRLYEYRFRGVDEDARRRVWKVIASDICDRMERPDILLDPAAGSGEFITAAPAQERWAVDRVAYGSLQNSDVKVIVSDIFDAELPPEYFDGVFISNFLEHLPNQDAVADLLERLRATLRPGGTIAILGPNFKYCAKEYFDCADHTLALTHVAVGEHLYAAGFAVRTVIPRFLPYSFRGLLPPSPALTRAYLKVPAVQRLLGKQFLLVAKKPTPS